VRFRGLGRAAACTAAVFLLCPPPAHAGAFTRALDLHGWLRQIAFALHDCPKDKTVLRLLARTDSSTEPARRDLQAAIHAFGSADALPLLVNLPGSYLDDLQPWARSALRDSRSHRNALLRKLTELTESRRAELLEMARKSLRSERTRERVISVLMAEKRDLAAVLRNPDIITDVETYSLLDDVVLGHFVVVQLFRSPDEYAKAWAATDATQRPARLYAWLRSLVLALDWNGVAEWDAARTGMNLRQSKPLPFNRQDFKDLRAFLEFARRELDAAARNPIRESPSASGNANVIVLARDAYEKPPPFASWAEESWKILQSVAEELAVKYGSRARAHLPE
jgi:hypothetical protein